MGQMIKAVTVSMLVGFLAFSPAASAQLAPVVTFDNMAGNHYSTCCGGANYGPGRFGPGSPATQQAMQFTPSTSGYLTSIFAPMTVFLGSSSVVELSLWSDLSDSPFSRIESSSRLVSPVTGGAVLEWTWAGNNLLETGIDYWIVAETASPRAVISWQYVPGYHSTDAVRANRTLGQDWTVFFGNGGETAMRIVVTTPIPEPSQFALLAIGLLVLGVVRTRRSR